jgi:hypothetical protein
MDHLSPQTPHADKIRREIEERGECIVSRAEARTLWAQEFSAADKWNAIAQFAIAEQWSFTFFPDGSVRFAPFDSGKGASMTCNRKLLFICSGGARIHRHSSCDAALEDLPYPE